MPLQLRRGNTAEVNSITPLVGEIVYDTQLKRVTVGDGSTAGGIAIAGVSLNEAKDAMAASIIAGTHKNISFVYNNTTKVLSATVDILTHDTIEADAIVTGKIFNNSSSVVINVDTGTFTGNLTGNVTGTVSGNAGTVTNGVYTTDTATVTNTMLAGSIANNKLANSSITINSTSVSLGGSITGIVTTSDTGTVTNTMLAGSIDNGKLSNSSVTINGTAISLGGSGTVTADANTLTSTTLNSTVVSSSLTTVGILDSLTINDAGNLFIPRVVINRDDDTGIAILMSSLTSASDTASGAEFRVSRGSLATPTNSSAGDPVFLLTGKVYKQDIADYGLSSAIVAAVGSDPLVGMSNYVSGELQFYATDGTRDLFDTAFAMTFNGAGKLTVPRLSVGDGTAANPSIVFSTDGGVDTGFFHPADGVVCISTNATEKVRVDTGGMRVVGFMKVGGFGTGSLPNPPEAGMIVLDTDTNQFKGYNGSSWVVLG